MVVLLAAHKIIKTKSLSLDVQHLEHLVAKLRLGEAEEIGECWKGQLVEILNPDFMESSEMDVRG